MGELERLRDLERRVAQLERQMEMLFQDKGLSKPPEPEIDAYVLELVKRNRIIEAIKEHQRLSGEELKRAKMYIEDLQKRVKHGEL